MSKLPGPKTGELVRALGTLSSDRKLEPLQITRRTPDTDDIVIQVDYCGVCHSDIHFARNYWNSSVYPVVPGHEIVGHVLSCGSNVKSFKKGDRVAVGTIVDTCRHCKQCKKGSEEYCETPGALIWTYNSAYKKDDGSHTYGGFADKIVVDQAFVFNLPENLPMHEAAPLLCAGITVYSPLKRSGVGKGTRVGVAGLGGLGHMAVKFAVAMGAHCTVLSRSEKKRDLALKMGAHEYIATENQEQMKAGASKLDVIIDTISADHDVEALMSLLDVGGTIAIIGIPQNKLQIHAFLLAIKRLNVTGSAVGSVEETKKMLKLCSEKNITCQVEVIRPDQINEAFERAVKGDVFFRFVIDLRPLRSN